MIVQDVIDFEDLFTVYGNVHLVRADIKTKESVYDLKNLKNFNSSRLINLLVHRRVVYKKSSNYEFVKKIKNDKKNAKCDCSIIFGRFNLKYKYKKALK